jgi:hypothetical protein
MTQLNSIARSLVQSRYGDLWAPEFQFRMTDPDGDLFATRRADGVGYTGNPPHLFVFGDSRDGVFVDPFAPGLMSLEEIRRSPDVVEALGAPDFTNPRHVEVLSKFVRHALLQAGAVGEHRAPPAPSRDKMAERMSRLAEQRPVASPARERYVAMFPFLGLVRPFDEISDPDAGVVQFAWVDGSLRGRDSVVVTVYSRADAMSVHTEVVRGFSMGGTGVHVHNRTRDIPMQEYVDLDVFIDTLRLNAPLEGVDGALDGSFWLLQAVTEAKARVFVRNSPKEPSEGDFRRICVDLINLSSIPEQSRRDILG